MFVWNFGTLLKEYTKVISVSYFSDFSELGISLVEEFRDGVDKIYGNIDTCKISIIQKVDNRFACVLRIRREPTVILIVVIGSQ
jgi:hypothetical protein